jgi:hypothetical protein
MSTLLFSMLWISSEMIYASGGRDEEMASSRERINIEGIDLNSLWNSSLAVYSSFTEFIPLEMSVSIELMDSTNISLLNQQAIINQEIINGKITRTITPVTSGPGNFQEDGRPETEQGGNMGEGGMPTRGAGKRGGNLSGKNTTMNPEIEREPAHHSEELTKKAIEFWDIFKEAVLRIESRNISGISTNQTSYIFDFPCISYSLSDSVHGFEGRIWIDLEKKYP